MPIFPGVGVTIWPWIGELLVGLFVQLALLSHSNKLSRILSRGSAYGARTVMGLGAISRILELMSSLAKRNLHERFCIIAYILITLISCAFQAL